MRVANVRAARGLAMILVGATVVGLGACGPGAVGSVAPTLSPAASASATPTDSTGPATSPPPHEPSATPISATSTPEVTPMPTVPLGLTSSAFTDGGAIPREYTCDGDDVSPPVAWAGLPDGSVGVALLVTDPDARGFVHWVVFDADPSSGGLDRGASTTAGAPSQGRNDFGRTGYGGPCPPSGTHHYVFRLLALDVTLALTGTPTASDVLSAATGHVLAETTLTATYRRGG